MTAIEIIESQRIERRNKKRNERIERCLSDISAVINKLNNGGE